MSKDMGLAAQADLAAVRVCPTCVWLRFAIEVLIGTEQQPQEAPEEVVLALLVRWQRHKDVAHPSLSAYLRRTT